MAQSIEERTAVLEVTVKELKESVEAHAKKQDKQYETIEAKMDDLLALKNKGMGAFWLASALVGSGVITAIMALLSWIKGAV